MRLVLIRGTYWPKLRTCIDSTRDDSFRDLWNRLSHAQMQNNVVEELGEFRLEYVSIYLRNIDMIAW